MHLERLAFVPQLSLALVVIPIVLAKKDLPSTMLVQTFAFVAFNKVCTSQVCRPSLMDDTKLLTGTVLPVVYDVPPVLHAVIFFATKAEVRRHGTRALDPRPGK